MRPKQSLQILYPHQFKSKKKKKELRHPLDHEQCLCSSWSTSPHTWSVPSTAPGCGAGTQGCVLQLLLCSGIAAVPAVVGIGFGRLKPAFQPLSCSGTPARLQCLSLTLPFSPCFA